MGFLQKKDPLADLTRQFERNPKDTRAAMEIANLLAKKNDKAGAIDHFIRAAKVFVAEGFHQKGVAAAKQALVVHPKNIEAHEYLADLYESVKLKEDQRAILKKLVDLYYEMKDPEAVTRTREKLAKLGPGR